ncbi:cholinesterase 1-like [Ctenocephalides felis]|uniref:cholinesterase 1-like n=1 Tax=Ctenocephalides felis TaxID=7515 RepID=UPI000E6E2567|nr:cholinesterase 1-like [Ctenocephalides felis]
MSKSKIGIVFEWISSINPNCKAIINGTTITGRSRNFIHKRNRTYCAFLGIPYAQPPTGNLSFEPPHRIDINKTSANNETFTANELKDMCIQREGTKIVGSEDCLYLNIYTPMLNGSNTDKNKTYPVMFWIHGGSFNTGSGTYNLYGPDYLVHEDVILVTINYRLGVFGFLSAPEWEIYGNMGLKDQLLALRWVNENIEAFKGNKSSITLFGESAGAASVHYLMMSNLTEGLYHRAISQSGSALNPWAIQYVPEQRFDKLKTSLSISNVTELRNKTAKLIIETVLKNVTTPEDHKYATDPVFNPVVEHKNSTNPIITKHLLSRMYKGEFPDVNIIYGFNDAEGLLAMNRVNDSNNEVNYTLHDVRRVIPLLFYNNKTMDESVNKTIKDLHDYYYWIHAFEQKYEAYIQLMGDAWFLHGIHGTLKAIHKNSNRTSKTYFYRLSNDSYSIYKQYVFTDRDKQKLPGVCHTDDLGYLFAMSKEVHIWIFGLTMRVYATIPDKAKETHEKIVTLWTNFAKTGNPLKATLNTTNEPKTYGNVTTIKWEPYNITTKRYLDINDTFEMSVFHEMDRMRYWDSVYKAYREQKKTKKVKKVKNKDEEEHHEKEEEVEERVEEEEEE